MAFCAYCGREVIVGAKFCVACGKEVYQPDSQNSIGQQQYNNQFSGQNTSGYNQISPNVQQAQPIQSAQPVQTVQFSQQPQYAQYQNHLPVNQVSTNQMPSGQYLVNQNMAYASQKYVPNPITFVGLIFNYFFGGFSGRCSRREWWLTVFLLMFFQSLFFGTVIYLGFYFFREKIGFETLSLGVYYVSMLINFIPSTMLTTRRLHDLDTSGWMQLVFYIPLIGWIYGLIVIFSPGTPGHNRFG